MSNKEKPQTPREISDVWQVAVVQIVSDYLFGAPKSWLDLVAKIGFVCASSVVVLLGFLYWRHPDIVEYSVYRENPIELRLRGISAEKKTMLDLYTKHVYDNSGAQWLALFDWRNLKDIEVMVAHGDLPENLKGMRTLPREWSKVMPDVIYEQCYPSTDKASDITVVCPILGDEDVWGLLVLYGVPESKFLVARDELRLLASRWSDVLY